MKTNRRGFFGALAGLVGGVYAAIVPKAKGDESAPKVYGKSPVPKLPEDTYIHVNIDCDSISVNSVTYTITGIDVMGHKHVLCQPITMIADFNEDSP